MDQTKHRIRRNSSGHEVKEKFLTYAAGSSMKDVADEIKPLYVVWYEYISTVFLLPLMLIKI